MLPAVETREHAPAVAATDGLAPGPHITTCHNSRRADFERNAHQGQPWGWDRTVGATVVVVAALASTICPPSCAWDSRSRAGHCVWASYDAFGRLIGLEALDARGLPTRAPDCHGTAQASRTRTPPGLPPLAPHGRARWEVCKGSCWHEKASVSLDYATQPFALARGCCHPIRTLSPGALLCRRLPHACPKEVERRPSAACRDSCGSLSPPPSRPQDPQRGLDNMERGLEGGQSSRTISTGQGTSGRGTRVRSSRGTLGGGGRGGCSSKSTASDVCSNGGGCLGVTCTAQNHGGSWS